MKFKKMSKKKSKRNFKRGLKTHKFNLSVKPMRGGIRF